MALKLLHKAKQHSLHFNRRVVGVLIGTSHPKSNATQEVHKATFSWKFPSQSPLRRAYLLECVLWCPDFHVWGIYSDSFHRTRWWTNNWRVLCNRYGVGSLHKQTTTTRGTSSEQIHNKKWQRNLFLLLILSEFKWNTKILFFNEVWPALLQLN